MAKTAVVYWSGTGNTEAMAKAVKQGAGVGAELISASDFGPGDVAKYDCIAFGCPAMGSEQLEDSEFAPMFDSVKDQLKGKKIALFGSYDWGDGEWLRTWEGRVKDGGATLAGSVKAHLEPDDAALSECVALGAGLA